MKRTDLASEAHAMWQQAGAHKKMPGIQFETKERGALRTTLVKITDDAGAKTLDKPKGTYLSMELGSNHGHVRLQAAAQLSEHLGKLLPVGDHETVMVVGLGNRAVTPDALGPRTVDQLLITQHLTHQFPYLRPVSALCPGVKGVTGMESLDVVRGVLQRAEASCVVVIDALAAAELSHIGSVVQVSDAGIQPGSGVGNQRAEFAEKTLGVPVIAIGVPTVTDLDTPESGMIVTSANIDAAIDGMAKMLASALNRALQPELSAEEIAEFVM